MQTKKIEFYCVYVNKRTVSSDFSLNTKQGYRVKQIATPYWIRSLQDDPKLVLSMNVGPKCRVKENTRRTLRSGNQVQQPSGHVRVVLAKKCQAWSVMWTTKTTCMGGQLA